jgi:hypothetical protein
VIDLAAESPLRSGASFRLFHGVSADAVRMRSHFCALADGAVDR